MSAALFLSALLVGCPHALQSLHVKLDDEVKTVQFSTAHLTQSGSQAAQDILSSVEEIASAGAKPDKIETIEKLAKELDTALHSTRDAAQQQVDDNLAKITKCNDDQNAAYSKISGTTKRTVADARTSHASCRESEVEKHAVKVKKCSRLEEFLKQVVTDGPEEPTGDDSEMVDYVDKMDSYWCPLGETARDKSNKCKQATAVHSEEKAKCDKLQAQFELDFCSWRVQLTDVCEAHTTCYDDALRVYGDHKTATQKLVEEWKVEYTALKKIACYINVWLNEDSVKEAHARLLNGCKVLNPDVSVMDVDFKSPEAKAVCSLADVENYPGTLKFQSTEYAKWDFVAEMSKCADEGDFKAGGCDTDDMRNANGRKMPLPPKRPFECTVFEGHNEVNGVQEKCPCKTDCDCLNTGTCVEAHVEAASPEAREACEAVKNRSSTTEQATCCRQLLRACADWQSECFGKMTAGYFSGALMQRSEHNNFSGVEERESAWIERDTVTATMDGSLTAKCID